MTYLWRDIDAQWWKKVKAAAAENHENIRQWMVRAATNAMVEQCESVKNGTGAFITKGWTTEAVDAVDHSAQHRER